MAPQSTVVYVEQVLLGIYEEEKPKMKSYECMHTLTGLTGQHRSIIFSLDQISHIVSPAQVAGFKTLSNAQKYGQKVSMNVNA